MGSYPDIEADAIDFTILSHTSDTAVWRQENLTLPPMFRPTFELKAKANKLKTNVNMTLKLVTPVTSTVDGNVVSLNTRVGIFSYTSLQNVTDSTNGEAIDQMINALMVLKKNFVQGTINQ